LLVDVKDDELRVTPEANRWLALLKTYHLSRFAGEPTW
jgi:hypothetical protein